MADNLVFQRPVNGALYMLNQGFKVFPIIPNGKTPAFKGWQQWAEKCTVKQVESYGIANPSYNWGVYCGPSDLCVIDIDCKDKDGFASMRELISANKPLPTTLTVTSPTGSKHLYYKGAGRTSTSAVAPGIDTRGVGGYVVAPGARINNKIYELTPHETIPPLPVWFLRMLDEKQSTPTTLSEVDLIDEGERNSTLTSLAGTMRKRGMNYDSVLAALLAVNEGQLSTPLSHDEVNNIATSICKYSPEHAEAASDFLNIPTSYKAKTADQINLKTIPKRDWIIYGRYIGKFITATISPGGVGKSTLVMLEAIAIATGMPLTGQPITKRGPTWIYNTEDPQDEIDRKLAAIQIYYGLQKQDLGGVHITSGRDQPLILVKHSNTGLAINTEAINKCIQYIKDNGIVLFSVDPFVRSHEVNENDNMQIDKVLWCFQHIANETGCAISLVHHARKPSSQAVLSGDANQARGASSLINATRIAHTLQQMTKEEASNLAIEESRAGWYARLDSAKANLSPPAEFATWFEKVSVTLPNTDEVGIFEVSDIVEDQQVKRQEAVAAENKDLVNAVAFYMQYDTTVAVSDVYQLIENDNQFQHLIRANQSAKHGHTKLRQALSISADNNVAGDKVLTLVERPKMRPKWVVHCGRISHNFLD